MSKNQTTPVLNRTVMSTAEFQKKAAAAGSSRCSDDFNGIEIADVTLENQSLARCEFNNSKLCGVVFVGADLEGIEFNFAELNSVTFYRCKLHRASFDFAKFTSVGFEECYIYSAASFDFASGDISFTNCQMEGDEFHGSQCNITMNNCNAGRIEFKGCANLVINAVNCDFQRADITDSVLHGTLSGCVCSDADFSGSDCRDVSFNSCILREINKSYAKGICNTVSDDDDDDDEFDF